MFSKAIRAVSFITKLSSFSILPTIFENGFSRTFTAISEQKEDGAISGSTPTFIHPTAIVHPDAVLGQGVSIGPFCMVGSAAKLGNHCQLHPGSYIFGDTELGERCVLLTGAIVGADLPGCTVIGRNNVIGYHSMVGVKCQDMKYKQGDECFLYVGDNNDIREFTSIHLSSKSNDRTFIGDNNLIMGSCHIAHDCKVGNNNIFANSTLLAGHVVVEDYAHTGGAIAVHQFCHIGSFSFIGGGSAVAQDVPKYMMVAGDRAELRGLNLEGLRRCGFSDVEVKSMRRAYWKIFMLTDVNSSNFEARLSELEQNQELANLPSVCSMLQSIRDSFAPNNRRICFFLNPRFQYEEGFLYSDDIRSGVTKVIERLAPDVTFAIEATREVKSMRRAYQKIFMPTDVNSSSFEARLSELEQNQELANLPTVCSMVQSIRDSFAPNRRGICKFRTWTGS